MLLLGNGQRVGAVSGGCVEKEIVAQAQTVFKDQKAKVITYDGRYRLGCEGLLYILIEPFVPDKETLRALMKALEDRKEINW